MPKCKYCEIKIAAGEMCGKCSQKLPLVQKLLKMVRDTAERNKKDQQLNIKKLVRDNIPEIIEKNGKKPIYYLIDDNMRYFDLLAQKLNEEVAEYHESKSIEELADILEVIIALCEAEGYTLEDLKTVYQRKHDERGGFSKGIFLIGVEEK